MAVVSVNRLFTARAATEDFQRRRTYREQWEVVVDSLLDDEQVVANAPGLPLLGQSHAGDAAALCVGLDPEQSGDQPLIWYVSVAYDTRPDFPQANDLAGGAAQDPGSIPENPLARPAVWRVTFEDGQDVAREWRVVDELDVLAAALTPVANSAGLPFDPPLVVDVSRPVLRVTKNVASVGFAYLMGLEGVINDREWNGIPKWCARVKRTEAGNRYENGVSYVELSFDIALNKDTWVPRVLDAGFFESRSRIDPDTGLPVTVRTRIRDPFGNEAIEPQPLSGFGTRLAPGDPPVYLRGLPRQYALADFATLLGL